jgi:thiol-disulfide isomerase/thioredoxin
MNFAFLAAAMISLAAPGDSAVSTVDGFQFDDAQHTQSNFAPAKNAAAGETMLLDFRADWCGPCRQMDSVVSSILAEGYPVRRVNVDQERELANRFGVTGIPCFVMVVNGREVDRVVGVTDHNRLQAMFSRNGVGSAANVVRGQSPGIGILSGGLSSSGIPFPPTQTASSDQDGSMGTRTYARADNAVRGDNAAARDLHTDTYSNGRGGVQADDSSASVPPAYDSLLRASVRLRIEDETGVSRGSGTIIDAREGEALIITCGHMFREAETHGKIWVDLFGPGAPQNVAGHLIDYDLKSEVGLINIKTNYPVKAARLAPPSYVVRTDDRVISMGCDGGADATAKETHVTSINRYVGAANLQVAFQPIQGRSGGGLFTPDGLVVGVCYAADPEAGEGLFTAPPALCDELDRKGLSFVYRELGNGEHVAADGRQPLPHGIETAQTDAAKSTGDKPWRDTGSVPQNRLAQATGQIQPAGQLEPTTLTTAAPAERASMAPSAPPGAAISADRNAAALSPKELAALQAVRAETAGAQIVCIVRPEGNPSAESEILVLNRVSPAMLDQLTAQQQTTQRR